MTGSLDIDKLLIHLTLTNYMSLFTTRVELHGASYSDYETLHEAMIEKGFSRYITSNDGIKYHLPTAEYDYQDSNRADVLSLAKAAAQATGKSFEVLVTEGIGRTWHNLSKT